MTEQEICYKLAALCSQAEHCCYEMTEKMRKWEVDDATQARIMEYLTREKYIDEKRYIRCFALDKIRYNKWGRRKVEQALWLKHISKSDMKEVLDEIEPDEYMQVLRPLLKAKMKGIKGRNEYERKMKLTRFALGRGFDYQQIHDATGWSEDMEDEGTENEGTENEGTEEFEP